jgi:hypothetical protein
LNSIERTMKTASVFLCCGLILAVRSAQADSLTVDAAANIFGAGHSSPPGGGSLPPSVSFAPAVTGTVLTFSSVTGEVIVNAGSGDNNNDADGIGNSNHLNVSSSNGISGISNDNAGFLVGVFLGPTEPSDPAPTGLSFGSGGTSFTSISPVLNQTFFVGDGLTGDKSGTTQQFNVPLGATRFYLGLADAPGYSGAPGAYQDNVGTFNATFEISSPAATPEASNIISLLAISAVGLGCVAYRKLKR